MNRRIRKKKEKQRQEWIEHLATVLAGLTEAIEAAEKEYWRQWAEESSRRFIEAVYNHYEQERRKEEVTQLQT